MKREQWMRPMDVELCFETTHKEEEKEKEEDEQNIAQHSSERTSSLRHLFVYFEHMCAACISVAV